MHRCFFVAVRMLLLMLMLLLLMLFLLQRKEKGPLDEKWKLENSQGSISASCWKQRSSQKDSFLLSTQLWTRVRNSGSGNLWFSKSTWCRCCCLQVALAIDSFTRCLTAGGICCFFLLYSSWWPFVLGVTRVSDQGKWEQRGWWNGIERNKKCICVFFSRLYVSLIPAHVVNRTEQSSISRRPLFFIGSVKDMRWGFWCRHSLFFLSHWLLIDWTAIFPPELLIISNNKRERWFALGETPLSAERKIYSDSPVLQRKSFCHSCSLLSKRKVRIFLWK